MMINRALPRTFIALTVLLLSSVASAGAEEIALLCDSTLRWGFIGPASEAASVAPQGPSGTRQDINTDGLTEYGPPDSYGNVRRLRTKRTTRTCGPLKIEFSSGWFNANPQGEMGEPEFAVFEISKDGKRILGPIAIGSCSPTGRQWNRCPANWAISVKMGWDGKQSKGYFELERSFTERRDWP